ncbi:MAG TPA: SIMPL domain-containing protein [Chloroflexota bacterium]|nr:SIMPL domain-containing protein [Chloroflexota bacterium]
MRTPEPTTARLVALFVIALLAVAVGASALATTAPAQMVQPTPGPRTLTVTGEGTASAAPDVAYVSVGVQTQGKTAVEATSENSRLMTSVLAALQARGVRPQDLRTSGLTVTPRYAPPPPATPVSPGPGPIVGSYPSSVYGHPGGEIVGYDASNNVTVTVSEVDRASELLDAALGAGANRVGGLTFRIRDTNALRQQALADAAQAARARADALAASLGLRVVGINSVQEDPSYANAYNAFPEIPAVVPQAAAPAPPPPVMGGELTVRTRAQVQFLFE